MADTTNEKTTTPELSENAKSWLEGDTALCAIMKSMQAAGALNFDPRLADVRERLVLIATALAECTQADDKSFQALAAVAGLVAGGTGQPLDTATGVFLRHWEQGYKAFMAHRASAVIALLKGKLEEEAALAERFKGLDLASLPRN